MTFKNRLLPLAIAGLLTLGFTSCSDDDDTTGTPTPETTLDIVATAQSVPDLSTLVEALTQADLVTALQASGDRTVLAPTNEAFQNFLDAKGFASLADVPNDVLSRILLNHVIDGSNIPSTELSGNTGYANTLASGAGENNMSVFYNGTDGVVFNGSSTVTTADVPTTNGVVHIVDTVIDLPTVVTFAVADPNFTTLVAALTREEDFTFVETLNSTDSENDASPFTVFAPTNEAFTSLLSELELDELADIDTEILSATLSTHVVADANVLASNLTDGMVISTLEADLTVGLEPATLTDLNDRTANIIATDVQASNGVIHVIDNVVLPQL